MPSAAVMRTGLLVKITALVPSTMLGVVLLYILVYL